jgi:hypothetical protein
MSVMDNNIDKTYGPAFGLCAAQMPGLKTSQWDRLVDGSCCLSVDHLMKMVRPFLQYYVLYADSPLFGCFNIRVH